MNISRRLQYKIFHYINGDSEKISSLANAESVEQLEEITGNTPSIYKVGTNQDMDNTDKEIIVTLQDIKTIEAYIGDNKIYTPSKSDFNYYRDDVQYHGQEDRTTSDWFNWDTGLNSLETIGKMGLRSVTNFMNYKRVAISLNDRNCGFYGELHNNEDMIRFQPGNNREINIIGIDNDDNIIYLYTAFNLFDLETDENKNYYYENTGVANVRNELETSFRATSIQGHGIFNALDYALQSTIKGLLNVNGYVDCNFWIFENDEDAKEYLRTGDSSKSINKEERQKPIDDTLYFYTYNESNIDEANKTLTNTTLYNAAFKLISSGDKVRFVKFDDNTCELIFNCSSVNLFVNGSYVETAIEDLDLYNHKVIINTSYNKKYGDLKTNIPIVNDFNEDADNGEDYTTPTKDNYTGATGLMYNTSLTGTGVTNIGCYHITGAILNNILSYLFTTDEDAYTTFKEKIWQYNENPSECIIDINYIPFNISAYVTKGLKTLQFGSLKFDGTHSYFPTTILDNIILSSKPVTNVNIKIQPTYGDFRDYNNLSYNLYLPYYGIIQLDRTCVNQNVRVVSYFDAFTGSLKYYVYIGSALVGAYNCSVGKHIAFMGSDWLNKSRENMQNAISNISSIGVSAVRGVSAVASGNVLGVASAVTDIGQSLISNNIQEGLTPSTMTQGVTSDGINIYDDMNFYLIIEEYETIKPTNLYQEYGIPCYIIGTLATCNGYCEVSTIKLNTSATEEEQKEIIELLKGGVIV